MFRYEQKTARLYEVTDGVETLLCDASKGAYSGHAEGLNNPDKQNVHDIGPIPVGHYLIGHPYYSENTGRLTMSLWPDASNQMFGRSAFKLHGDNRKGDHSASHGCIILPHDVREHIAAAYDSELEVVHG